MTCVVVQTLRNDWEWNNASSIDRRNTHDLR
jgi:hypothetical protein